MLAHQRDLIKYESSLQNREKALDVALNTIQDHASQKGKKGLQTYHAFLRIQEKSLMDVIVAINVGADIFGLSTIHETLKKKVDQREDEIKEIKLKILDNRESQHLGCKAEIENMKFQITTLQKKNMLQ